MNPSTQASTSHDANQPKVALALAGGGPLGAIYEIGALCALAECIQGVDLTQCTHYVGVSAGGFIAASLANGMTPHDLCRLFIANDDETETFDPAWLMRPAYREIFQRMAQWPRLGATSFWAWAAQGKSLIRALEQLAPALPTGIFSNDEIDKQVAKLFSKPGRTNDFRELAHRLTLVATHLDTGEAAPFGREGWDHVPISKAIAASAALPGLFPPVEIDGRYYVDGALKKTMHATIALDEGIDVMLCLNPLVPFDASASTNRWPPSAYRERKQKQRRNRFGNIPSMVQGGLPAVMSQTFRSLIHSRLELGMKQYEHNYPNTAIVLIEPDHRDSHLYLANTFSYSQRRQLAEHAYQQTRQWLRQQTPQLKSKLNPHGIDLNARVLGDLGRRLLTPAKPVSGLLAALDRLQNSVDDLQHVLNQRSV